jgi:hypothetical protein
VANFRKTPRDGCFKQARGRRRLRPRACAHPFTYTAARLSLGRAPACPTPNAGRPALLRRPAHRRGGIGPRRLCGHLPPRLGAGQALAVSAVEGFGPALSEALLQRFLEGHALLGVTVLQTSRGDVDRAARAVRRSPWTTSQRVRRPGYRPGAASARDVDVRRVPFGLGSPCRGWTSWRS